MKKLVFAALSAFAFTVVTITAVGQTAYINDTNTAIILWSPPLEENQGVLRPNVLGPAGVFTAERRGIGIGQQGYGTALGPGLQTNPPTLLGQTNQTVIGQQGSSVMITGVTNPLPIAVGTNNLPLPGAQTNSPVVAQTNLMVAPQGPTLPQAPAGSMIVIDALGRRQILIPSGNVSGGTGPGQGAVGGGGAGSGSGQSTGSGTGGGR